MIALVQRVSTAAVQVDGTTVGSIGRGILALIGIARGDSPATADHLLDRVLSLRMFGDDAGKMNLDLAQIEGGLLLVPQFTLLADTTRGTRPGFSRAAPPALAAQMFAHLSQRARERHPVVATGRFGAHMAVSLVNEGPVTFWLDVP